MRGVAKFIVVFLLALAVFIPLGIAGGLGLPGLLLGLVLGLPVLMVLLAVGLPVLLAVVAVFVGGTLLLALLGMALGLAMLALKFAIFVVLPIALVIWVIRKLLGSGRDATTAYASHD